MASAEMAASLPDRRDVGTGFEESPDERRWAAHSLGSHQAPGDSGVNHVAAGLPYQETVRNLDDPWLTLLATSNASPLSRVLYGIVIKRCLDLLLAGAALVLVTPILLLAALVIRIDSPGPVLFRQVRIGRGGRPFVVFKLRTMQHTSSADLQLVRDADGQLRHKVRNDPRVTRVGRWLRRSSIDELPQLLNVVRGEMSLVGPRPELPQIVAQYAPWQHQRHLVRPGLTGWWQVAGRSDRPMHEYTELDNFYVQQLSFLLDLRIALKTVRVVLRGLGAF